MKIILTGFAPFGGETINPSYQAIKLLPDSLDGCELIKLEMPVSFEMCASLLVWMISQYHPDAVICLGQAGGRTAITPEYVAINLKHSVIPDNSGVSFSDQPVLPGAPSAYFTNLPVRRMVKDMQAAGLPAFVSYSCGTFVCNCMMYNLLHHIQTVHPELKGGFIHVPYSLEQVKNKCLPPFAMETEEIARGVEICVRALISDLRD
jgi:pyroglutamyl-peptidase